MLNEHRAACPSVWLVDLDPDPPQIEIVVSSVRGEVRVKERVKPSLIETEQGWKLDQPSTEILSHERIDATVNQ
jgi:hypothetical protein